MNRLRSSTAADPAPPMTHINEDLLILICGHARRDARCGVYGPVLQQEFTRALARVGIQRAQVATTSHVGGHQFAGNVGIWFPPSSEHLGGHGVWYGRVTPKHVEGIVHETILRGRIIADLLRGGIDEQSRTISIH